ncbi:MAG: putative flap endonuclease-1-like 5' DNA nuclease [Patiriisocius sp.]|jgi:predicted flap endonuclease-1-like 5' DNA nuclease
MTAIDNYINQLQTLEFISVLILMLSTFLIGYFSGFFLEKNKKKTLINSLKNEINTLKASKKINDIETIFTEIKPKIIQVLKETQRQEDSIIYQKKSKENIVEQTRNDFINHSPKKLTLDFEIFGFGDKYNPDSLAEIEGIGPYTEEKLNEIGIYNFKQISRLQPKDIYTITNLIDFFPGRIERDDWIGQAKLLILTY